MAAVSIVDYMHEHGGYKCGYCGASDTNFSHGMWAHYLSCQDYQNLIDRGWRRSGSYLYKPQMKEMCCPCYTIKCEALEFKPSKSQRRVLKRMIRFLSGSGDDAIAPKDEGDTPASSEHPAQENGPLPKQPTPPPPPPLPSLSSTSVPMGVEDDPKNHVKTSEDAPTDATSTSEPAKVSSSSRKGRSTRSNPDPPRPGRGIDPSKPISRKAKDIRRQKRLDRLAKSGIADPKSVEVKSLCESKSLEELLRERTQGGSKHKLEIRYVQSSPKSEAFKETLKESYNLYFRYQTTIHKDPPSKPSENQFKRFLVDSPLQMECPLGAPTLGYGSFHEHFLLDDKIIAVGVIDVLPSCISSVYFFYDPDYSFLSLGTYSALRELEFTRQLHRQSPQIQHYYMGFYIHSCVKMRYKGEYQPSFLLCPEVYTWHPIEQCRPKLDASKYSRFNQTDAVDTPVHLPDVRVLYKHACMRYINYRQLAPDANDEKEVEEYAQFVGKTCSMKMVLYRH